MITSFFKGTWKIFLNKNICFVKDNKKYVARWSNIIKAYELDGPLGTLRTFKKLTDFHIYPSEIKKNESQLLLSSVFLQVASGIRRMNIDRMYHILIETL